MIVSGLEDVVIEEASFPESFGSWEAVQVELLEQWNTKRMST